MALLRHYEPSCEPSFQALNIAKLSVHYILFAANLVLVAALCTLPAVVLLLATVLSLAHQPAHKLPVTRL